MSFNKLIFSKRFALKVCYRSAEILLKKLKSYDAIIVPEQKDEKLQNIINAVNRTDMQPEARLELIQKRLDIL